MIAKLEALGCDPIEGMARIAMDEANTPELRGKMYAELSCYIAPKRKAIDHSSDGSMSGGVTGIRDEFVSPNGEVTDYPNTGQPPARSR